MRETKHALLAAAWLALAGAPASADQSSLTSPTTGTVSGVQLTNNYNAALNALATCNSGSSAPVNASGGVPIAGQCWLNTANSAKYLLEVYDGSSWLVEGALDTVAHLYEPVVGAGAATLSSAATVDLGANAQFLLTISGTTTISSFGSSAAAGNVKSVVFSGSLTLTNSASLVLPNGGANITTAASDRLIAVAQGAGIWNVVNYSAANGRAVQPPVYSAPQVAVYTTGSGTYTTPAGALFLEVEACGGGSGGSGAGLTTTGGAGGAGGATTFGSFGANGGPATPVTSTTTYPTPAGVTGSPQFSINGAVGGPGNVALSTDANQSIGGHGAASAFGDGGNGGAGGYIGPSQAYAACAGGGGGATGASAAVYGGWGGNAGAYFKHVISSPSATYSYSVGAAGTAGSAGTSGTSGAAGAGGIIRVVARFQ